MGSQPISGVWGFVLGHYPLIVGHFFLRHLSIKITVLTEQNFRAIIHTDMLNLRSNKYNNIILQFIEGCMRIPAEERALNSNLLVPITKTSSGERDKENATENII